jgi:GAF domain-containing protein
MILAADARAALETGAERLLAATGASRVTVRADVPGADFPVVAEALAPGVASLRDDHSVQSANAPTPRKLRRDRQIVVVDDCAGIGAIDPEYDDDGFRAMLVRYGGLAAFIAAPVLRGGDYAGVIAVHQLGAPRRWRDSDLEAVRELVALTEEELA